MGQPAEIGTRFATWLKGRLDHELPMGDVEFRALEKTLPTNESDLESSCANCSLPHRQLQPPAFHLLSAADSGDIVVPVPNAGATHHPASRPA